MIKIGYKVVTSELGSVAVFNHGAVKYGVGKSTQSKPGCGPLTVFTCLYGAAHFRERLQPLLRIFKCCYIPSLSSKVWYTSGSNYVEPIIKSLKELVESNTDCIIPGSVDLADEVILVEEL